MPKPNLRGGANKPAKKGTLKRILSLLFKGNKWSLVIFFIC